MPLLSITQSIHFIVQSILFSLEEKLNSQTTLNEATVCYLQPSNDKSSKAVATFKLEASDKVLNLNPLEVFYLQ